MNRRETLSDLIHELWAKWMRYMFGHCIENADGSIIIPKEKVDRWRRQMVTPYAELAKDEKDSDREQVDELLAVMDNQKE